MPEEGAVRDGRLVACNPGISFIGIPPRIISLTLTNEFKKGKPTYLSANPNELLK